MTQAKRDSSGLWFPTMFMCTESDISQNVQEWGEKWISMTIDEDESAKNTGNVVPIDEELFFEIPPKSTQ